VELPGAILLGYFDDQSISGELGDIKAYLPGGEGHEAELGRYIGTFDNDQQAIGAIIGLTCRTGSRKTADSAHKVRGRYCPTCKAVTQPDAGYTDQCNDCYTKYPKRKTAGYDWNSDDGHQDAQYGDTRPYQDAWSKRMEELKAEQDACPYCKRARNKTGDPRATCRACGYKESLEYRTHPASETYWTSMKKRADDNTLQLGDMNQAPATPVEFDDETYPEGAADVAGVPSPENGYPQPADSAAAPAIADGEAPVEPWTAEVTDPVKTSAFRSRIQQGFQRKAAALPPGINVSTKA
jgi:DNA-directed RNA polymerase subunit M/transcription elongation factor TFIIS